MPNAVNSLMTSVLLNLESKAESVLQELQRHTLSGPHGLPSATVLLHLDPGLLTVDDPLLILIPLFGTQWQSEKIAPSKRQVWGRTAEDAMRQVGQAFSSLGMLI
ncbi:unnamed protein product [Cylindrotheca closterium]|uniref:Uncharacterized protein n=1 Tax=Cylindrotheca closterium TaxID=2856 RepID=A0AAD2CTS9_9STRA|nr:unnamed protein product [Cylindrotheca closterium]